MFKKINEDFIKDGGRRIKEADFKKVMGRAARISSKFASVKKLSGYFDDIKALIEMVKDYASGSYRRTPYRSMAIVVFTLLYLSNPFDIIPDFIPFLGLADDVAVISLCLSMIGKDLDAYRKWKSGDSEKTAGS